MSINIIQDLQLLVYKNLSEKDREIADSYEIIREEIEKKEDVYQSKRKQIAIRKINQITRNCFLQAKRAPICITGKNYTRLLVLINKLRIKYSFYYNLWAYVDANILNKSQLVYILLDALDFYNFPTTYLDIFSSLAFINNLLTIKYQQVYDILLFLNKYNLEELDDIYHFLLGNLSSFTLKKKEYSLQHGELVIDGLMVWAFDMPYIIRSNTSLKISLKYVCEFFMFNLMHYYESVNFSREATARGTRQIEKLSKTRIYYFFTIFNKKQLISMIENSI